MPIEASFDDAELVLRNDHTVDTLEKLSADLILQTNTLLDICQLHSLKTVPDSKALRLDNSSSHR